MQDLICICKKENIFDGFIHENSGKTDKDLSVKTAIVSEVLCLLCAVRNSFFI